MYRALLAGYFCLACSIVLANESSTISPGMDLAGAKAIAQKYGCGYGQEYGLAMAATDRNHALEFVRIDSATTLVISYVTASSKISSLDVDVIPNYAPKLHRQQTSLNIQAISFGEDGTYTLKLKRASALIAEPK